MNLILQAIKSLFRKVWGKLGELEEKVEGARAFAVQANYAQNDPAAPDHIKNRLCYKKQGDSIVTVTVSGEAGDTVTVQGDFSELQYRDSGTHEHIVVVNGVEHSCWIQCGEGYMYVSIKASVGFTVQYMYETSMQCKISTGGNYTIEFRYRDEYVKLPIDYLETGGKGFSANDFTDELLDKLIHIEDGANKYVLKPAMCVAGNFSSNSASIGGIQIMSQALTELRLDSYGTLTLNMAANIDDDGLLLAQKAKLAIEAAKTELRREYREDLRLASSTEGSAKKFKITVDDSGTISATEVVTETTEASMEE